MERGAYVLYADELGRELMQPGQAVFESIVRQFGPGVVTPEGTLDRPALSKLAFAGGRLEELNAIVHPATIALQKERTDEIARRDPAAVVVVESALLFETKYGGPEGWRQRFDKVVLVTAPEALRVERFAERMGATDETRAALEAEARRRLAAQMPDVEKIPFCDYVLRNEGDLAALEAQVEAMWQELRAAAGQNI